MGSFVERIQHLINEVGEGDLVMSAQVHQPYAAAEHNHAQNKHPRGGMANYLEAPFRAELPMMMEKLAMTAVVPSGSLIKEGAREVAEMFDTIVTRFAPVLEDILRDSTFSRVYDNGSLIYVSNPRDPYRYDKE